MNKEYSKEECPRCLEVEDWEHVLLYASNKVLHKEFIYRLKVQLIESEEANAEAYKILQFANDMQTYLEGSD